jgi:hypothetical protein
MPTSPCSVPEWLRLLIPLETHAQQSACQEHDDAYNEGGTRRHRLLADIDLLDNLIWADMDPDLAEMYFWGVRMYGGMFWATGDGPGARCPQPPETQEAP